MGERAGQRVMQGVPEGDGHGEESQRQISHADLSRELREGLPGKPGSWEVAVGLVAGEDNSFCIPWEIGSQVSP